MVAALLGAVVTAGACARFFRIVRLKDDMALEMKWGTHNFVGWFDGFEPHVAVNQSQVAAAVNESLSRYLGWDVYFHKENGA